MTANSSKQKSWNEALASKRHDKSGTPIAYLWHVKLSAYQQHERRLLLAGRRRSREQSLWPYRPIKRRQFQSFFQLQRYCSAGTGAGNKGYPPGRSPPAIEERAAATWIDLPPVALLANRQEVRLLLLRLNSATLLHRAASIGRWAIQRHLSSTLLVEVPLPRFLEQYAAQFRGHAV